MAYNWFHSVRMDEDKCLGCMNCLKHCPTEAIRVRDGKDPLAKELAERFVFLCVGNEFGKISRS